MTSRGSNSSQFAILFADLMMGAMAVLIVMIVFLSIVDVKGLGESQAVESTRLPPGLIEDGADPLVRIRLSGCSPSSFPSDTPPFEINSLGSQPPVEILGPLGTKCFLQRFDFEKGLKRRAVRISATSPLELNSLSITLTVGGWLMQKDLAPARARETDSPIAVVSLTHPKIIIEP